MLLSVACVVNVSCGSSPSQPVEGATRDEAARVAPSTEQSDVANLTGATTRIVWTQDVGDGADFNSLGDRLMVMGYDSHDGLGERPILAEPSNYAKPLITPRGDRVVFSNRPQASVFIVNWDGSGLRRLANGFALAVWMDPNTDIEWIYAGSNPGPSTEDPYHTVTRYQIDRPEVSELVWDKAPVSEDSFQLSPDGRNAGGVFPWPDAGIAELPDGSWQRLGEGCWTGLAYRNPLLFWYFDGAHRNVTLVDVARDTRWLVNISGAPGIDGYEVYHPRWSNHPRFLTMTGPYSVGSRENKIRGGGQGVEVYLGRFTDDFTAVEHWTQVTHNGRADFYPDAWIDPAGRSPTAGGQRAGPTISGAVSGEPDRQATQRLVVEARVRAHTPVPTPMSIEPYKRALLVNEYEIIRVIEGSYDDTTLLVAHWIIRDGQLLSTAAREVGSVHHMVVEAYDDHLELEGERLVMDSTEFGLRLYYDVGS